MAASIKILEDPEDEKEEPAIEDKKDICRICVEKEARYTCPRCNIRYCSLPCYQHKKHEGCSESFYKDWVMDEMKEHVARPEDKQKILEMLEREHEQLAEDLENDDDTPSLAERMEGLDLDKDGAEVWKRLTTQEREEFAHMLKDGRLASLITIWTPWWTNQTASKLVQEVQENKLPKGFPAHATDFPDINQLLKQSKPSADVKHNVVNVISAYAFITRLHNGDHQEYAVECSEELLQVCGVLGQGENYPGVKEAVHSVIQQVQKTGSGFVVPASFPVVLMGDLIHILRGFKLSPLCSVLSALSDTLTLLKAASRETKKAGKAKGRKQSKGGKQRQARPSDSDGENEPDLTRQLFLAKKKLTFLLSWTQRYGMCLASLCDEMLLELECLKSEAAEDKSLQQTLEKAFEAGKLRPQAAKIEELKEEEAEPTVTTDKEKADSSSASSEVVLEK